MAQQLKAPGPAYLLQPGADGTFRNVPALLPQHPQGGDCLLYTSWQFLPLTHILKLSDEELPFLTGTEDIEAALPTLLSLIHIFILPRYS